MGCQNILCDPYDNGCPCVSMPHARVANDAVP
jgi:hypothetical protein